MEMRRLTPRYYVSPQIAAEDMPALRDAGITRILCNRPACKQTQNGRYQE